MPPPITNFLPTQVPNCPQARWRHRIPRIPTQGNGLLATKSSSESADPRVWQNPPAFTEGFAEADPSDALAGPALKQRPADDGCNRAQYVIDEKLSQAGSDRIHRDLVRVIETGPEAGAANNTNAESERKVQHQNSARHRRAVALFLGLSKDNISPPSVMFSCCWEQAGCTKQSAITGW
ncbi:hypothetical protein BC835DRAFT_1445905 [Cytidiella melzeri]|nr:hypothetical protein BC835DRAFT_1445905 [Cytidiella melzeri]